ncbi:MAG: DUF2911 domain-containing protein [Myxococcaceae bacterium]
MRTFLAVALLVGSLAQAQGLKLPQQSPAATVSQQVGLTDITVSYHRPGVGGRAIWGELVPYGDTWRAGANENTTITFSSDAKVEGKAIKAGTYGLHMIPVKGKDWTVAFSNVSSAWGSFTYDQKEDALRVTVKPHPIDTVEERLSYRFDNPTDTTVTLVMSWEKLAVPMAISVETPKVTMASVRTELRGILNYDDRAQTAAADYWLKNGGAPDEGLKMVEKAIARRPSYANLMIKAGFLEKQGKAKDAEELRTKAKAIATENELNNAAYGLMADKKIDEAIKMFQAVVEKYPDSWNAHDSLGEALLTKGDKAGAAASYKKALALAKDPVQKKRIEGVLARIGS